MYNCNEYPIIADKAFNIKNAKGKGTWKIQCLISDRSRRYIPTPVSKLVLGLGEYPGVLSSVIKWLGVNFTLQTAQW